MTATKSEADTYSGTTASMSLADKLNRLFVTIRRPDGREWTPDAVAAQITAGGEKISGIYVYMLKTGRKDNPTKRHLEALARFFGVDAAYFFDNGKSTEEIDAQLQLLAVLRDAKVRDVALRTAGLSPEALNSIRTMIDYSRAREGLPDQITPV